MSRCRVPAAAMCVLFAAMLPAPAKAQPHQSPSGPAPVLLGTARVGKGKDHAKIKVSHQSGAFGFVQLRAASAPVRFDHMVIHYRGGPPVTVTVGEIVPAGGRTEWIALPESELSIHSFELWCAGTKAGSSTKLEMQLYAQP